MSRSTGGTKWATMRKRILDRDGWICGYCGVALVTSNATVDHIIPQIVAPHLRYDPDNLRAACRPCNGAKAGHDKKMGQIARGQRTTSHRGRARSRVATPGPRAVSTVAKSPNLSLISLPPRGSGGRIDPTQPGLVRRVWPEPQ